MIGLSIMLGWGGAELIERFPRMRTAVAGGAVLACAACLVVTWSQIQYWASSETLYRHTLAVTQDNYITRHHLADYYLETNRHEEALREEAEAVRIKPAYLDARLNMALALNLLGRPAEAEAEYRRSLEQHPQGKLLYVAHSGLGAALASQGRTAEALPELQLAARLKPESAESHYNLGTALSELGRVQEAAAELSIAVRLRPDDPDARQKLAIAFAAQGRLNEAVDQFRALVAMRPDDAAAHCNLAIALARAGQNTEAIAHYTEALRLNPDFEPARRGLQLARQ
jgi:tetratricopeptide (TPR) repeat protein